MAKSKGTAYSEVNIRNVSDPFERYKMPKLETKIEGSGNGIRTVVVNLVDVARALNRPPIYLIKYFGCELGAQVRVSKTDPRRPRHIVNGVHAADRLCEVLGDFIEEYVLCVKCENPETILQAKSSGRNKILLMTCKACGLKGEAQSHSAFFKFLIRDLSNQASKEDLTEADSFFDDDFNSPKTIVEEDEGDWFEESPEERLETLSQLPDHIRSLISVGDSSESVKSEQQRLDEFYSYCQELRKSGQLFNQPEKVYRRARTLVMHNEAPLLLIPLLVEFDLLAQTLGNAKPVLEKFTSGNITAQCSLLGGVERLVAYRPQKQLQQNLPALLQWLYLEDIVEEIGFQRWAREASLCLYTDDESTKRIHLAAKPFMEWLSRSEEDDQVVFTHQQKVPSTLGFRRGSNVDDLDVDAI